MNLTGYNILLGLTGGIAAYKAAYLARLLIKAGAAVQVIMTEAATKFITPLTFEALTNRQVAVEMFPADRFAGTHHIAFAEWPDLIVVAPATADFIAQVTHGHCASLLSAVVCASRRPLLLAPAMNEGMYASAAVQENLSLLRRRGVLFADVGTGEMACNSYGPGRMAEPDEIFERIVACLRIDGPLSGRKVVVTAGPSREPIDPVRFISNRSSGKMGFALARQAHRLGAEVSLITGPVALADPEHIGTHRVETTAEMAEAVLDAAGDADYVVMAAAPADYSPTEESPQKIKKTAQSLALDLSPTVDILKKLADHPVPGRKTIGFALETENELENAKIKLSGKKLDFIVVNSALEAGAGFDSDTNHVTVLSAAGDTVHIDKADKEIIAKKLWEYFLTHG